MSAWEQLFGAGFQGLFVFAYAIAGSDAYIAGQPDNAMRRVVEAMKLAESTGARTAMIHALRTLGSVEMARGRKVEGLEAYDRARRTPLHSRAVLWSRRSRVRVPSLTPQICRPFVRRPQVPMFSGAQSGAYFSRVHGTPRPRRIKIEAKT